MKNFCAGNQNCNQLIKGVSSQRESEKKSLLKKAKFLWIPFFACKCKKLAGMTIHLELNDIFIFSINVLTLSYKQFLSLITSFLWLSHSEIQFKMPTLTAFTVRSFVYTDK